MAAPIPDKVRNFIFEHIDSVELLHALLLFFAEPTRSWTAVSVAAELRTNPNSVARRLEHLEALGIIAPINGSDEFCYRNDYPQAPVLSELATAYRIQPHKVLEMIFSPLKKARDFADSFSKSPRDGKKGKSDA